VSVPIDRIVFSEWSITGSLGNPHSDYPELLQLVDSGKLTPGQLISEQVALRDVQSVFDRMPSFDTDGFVILTDFS
jgi:D-arabinose 1-dehydrogenase-like Zn-dependent alcohol dehydrogenase